MLITIATTAYVIIKMVREFADMVLTRLESVHLDIFQSKHSLVKHHKLFPPKINQKVKIFYSSAYALICHRTTQSKLQHTFFLTLPRTTQSNLQRILVQ